VLRRLLGSSHPDWKGPGFTEAGRSRAASWPPDEAAQSAAAWCILGVISKFAVTSSMPQQAWSATGALALPPNRKTASFNQTPNFPVQIFVV
jgi:hypothetical protein